MNFVKRGYFIFIQYLIDKTVSISEYIYHLFSNPKQTAETLEEVRKLLHKGDCLIVRNNGFSVIPGFWKHAAIYVGGDMVVEAIIPKVVESRLDNIILHCTDVAIMRLIDCTEQESIEIVVTARSLIGTPYDRTLDLLDKLKVYCSEIFYRAVNNVRPGFLSPRMRMGYPAFSPEDCYKARKKFVLVKEFLSVKQDNKAK